MRITCCACKRRELLDREELIQWRSLALKNCDWASVVREAICAHCGSHDVKVDIEAFAEGLPELRRRRTIMITLELALKILLAASYSAQRKSVPVEAVRLALRTVHPLLQSQSLLEGFWTRYADPDPKMGENPATVYSEIVKQLLKRGYPIPAELRHGNWPGER